METSTPRIHSVNEPDIELHVINPHLYQTRTAKPEFSPPPVNGGKDAWLFLFSAFVLEIIVWDTTSTASKQLNLNSTDLTTGFPFAFGIFQKYYTSNAPFAGSRNIPIIGTCALGLIYLSSPFLYALSAWYPKAQRSCIMIGLVIMCLSLRLSSLSQTVLHLIVSQGLFYAIGAAMCYSPGITFMDEWFVRREGLAFGIMWDSLHSLPSVESYLPLSG
jgi:MFS family permease